MSAEVIAADLGWTGTRSTWPPWWTSTCIESAYLLQRMESFDGLAILATNLRANLDDAFTRRLDAVVDFPVPDEPLRRALWERCLGTLLPRR